MSFQERMPRQRTRLVMVEIAHRYSGFKQSEEIVAVLMIQTPVRDMRPEFENAVMQAIVK